MSDIPDSNPTDADAESPGDGNRTEDSLPWRAVFDETAVGLRAFLGRRLQQASDVDDCLQAVFVKMMEKGQHVAPAARRAWLFRVAANESARMWRSNASTRKMVQKQGASDDYQADPSDPIVLSETTDSLRQALQRLPPPWQDVVRLRIHDDLTFQQIATQLNIPLGTALTQMRRALERLRSEMESDEP